MDSQGGMGCFSVFLIALSYLLVVTTFPISIFLCIKIVQEYQRAVIYRLGRLKDRKGAGPGMFFVLPCTDSCNVIDLRTVSTFV